MGNENRTAIQILSDALAELTARAHEAERERDAAKRLADEWAAMYDRMEKRAKEAEDKLVKLTEKLEEMEDEGKYYG